MTAASDVGASERAVADHMSLHSGMRGGELKTAMFACGTRRVRRSLWRSGAIAHYALQQLIHARSVHGWIMRNACGFDNEYFGSLRRELKGRCTDTSPERRRLLGSLEVR